MTTHTVEELEHELEQARQGTAQVQEAFRQYTSQTNIKLSKLTGENHRLEQENISLAAQIDLWIERVEELNPEQVEAQAARAALLEQENTRLTQELDITKKQVQQFVDEMHAEHRTLLDENTDLRGELAEVREEFNKLHHDENNGDGCQGCHQKEHRIQNLLELREFDSRVIQEYYDFKSWLKEHLLPNQHIESARKITEIALRFMIEDHQDEHGYASINIQEFSGKCGFSRQTGGRLLHESVDDGAHSEIIDLEECTIPDKRRGKRKIEKKHYRLAETALLQHPEDLRKPGVKKQGGSIPRCKRCNGENTLKHIYHTLCTVCGYEDIYYDDEALMIKHECEHSGVVEGSLQQNTPLPAAPAAQPTVSEPEAIDVQDEQQSQTPIPAPVQHAARDMDTEIMAIARSLNHPSVSLPEIQIAAGEQAWSRWMWMSHATQEQHQAVYAYLTGTDVHLEQESAPAPQADEEEETPEQHKARMAESDARIWATIEANDPGCWVPESVIATWKSQGRIYTPARPREEESARPQARPQKTSRKAVDFSSGNIVEVAS